MSAHEHKDAEKWSDIQMYYVERQYEIDALKLGVKLVGLNATPFGGEAWYLHQGNVFVSIFCRKSLRGKGLFEKTYHTFYKGITIITINDCDLVSFLDKKKIPYICLDKVN